MNKRWSKTYYIHCKINDTVILNEIDKIAESLTKRNNSQKPFTRSDVIRRAVEQYVWNMKADRKI